MPVAPRAGAANAGRDTGLVDAGATGGPTGGATAGAATGLANGVLKVGFPPPGGLKPAPGRKGGLNAAAGLATGGWGFAFVSGRDGDSGARSATSSPPLSSGAARFIARGFLGTLRWQSILFETKICFVRETGATTPIAPHNTTTRATQTKQMSSNMARVETRAGKRKRERDANAGEAIPGLLNDIVVTHVLRSEYFDDPADLARLRVVSQSMRDAVTATGLKVEEVVNGSTAVELGCLSALRRLQRRGRLSTEERKYFCEAAARGGHLEELKVLRANGCPWDEQTCSHAAAGGNLEVLQWARANGCPWSVWTCGFAAMNGHLEVLQRLRENGCPWSEQTCAEAAGGGNLGVLQWLRENGCPWSVWACALAATWGHLEVLQWARANGCPWDEETCSLAAGGGIFSRLHCVNRSGRFEVLQWLHANGCPWNADMCEEAARHGDLEMLQRARANGCPWDRFTCQFAAQCGHLEVLKWARANGCPWNVNTCYMVAGPDNLELKKWLRANGYPETYSDDSVDEEEDDFSEDYESDDESE